MAESGGNIGHSLEPALPHQWAQLLQGFCIAITFLLRLIIDLIFVIIVFQLVLLLLFYHYSYFHSYYCCDYYYYVLILGKNHNSIIAKMMK